MNLSVCMSLFICVFAVYTMFTDVLDDLKEKKSLSRNTSFYYCENRSISNLSPTRAFPTASIYAQETSGYTDLFKILDDMKHYKQKACVSLHDHVTPYKMVHIKVIYGK